MLVLQLGQIEPCQSVWVIVADGILVGTNGFGVIVNLSVALCHLPGPDTTLLFFCGLGTGVGFLVFGSSIKVFANGIKLIAFLQVVVGTTGREQAYSCKNKKEIKGDKGR